MLKKIFQIISFYDKARWISSNNYFLINFYKDTISDDSKLLTHWFCYITDRQMAFQRIWDIGGFVFSEMIEDFKTGKGLEILNPANKDSFIKKKKANGYEFRGKSKAGENKRLQSFGFRTNAPVNFASRYYPSDYFSMLFTFDILGHFDYSLTKFISIQLSKHINSRDYIKRLLFSLYLLTYFEVGQPSKEKLKDFDKNALEARKRTAKVLKILDEDFENEYGKFKKHGVFFQKRAWCSLRDFIKSPEFKHFFENSLINQKIDSHFIKQLFSLEAYEQLELPGDVWNNNSKFRNCILEKTEYETSSKGLNYILRDYFEKNKNELSGCYPEQFDVTFSFVPRMCENYNCNLCPIAFAKGAKSSKFKKTCVKKQDLFCSVALTNCNYLIDCAGSDCELLSLLNQSNQ